MTEPTGESTVVRERSKSPAWILYFAIVAGAVICVVVLTVLGARGIVLPMLDTPRLPVRIVGMMILVLGFVATGVLSGGIPPRKTKVAESEWWKANSVKAVSTWALAEGLAIMGGVFWLLTGDMVLYVGLVGGGLVLLLLNHPHRMLEG